MNDLIKWRPNRSLFPAFSHDMFDFDPFCFDADWNPAVDIYEDEGTIVVKMELPEVDKKDVSVSIKDKVLTIRGERKEEKQDKYFRKELYYGSFKRCFSIPDLIDTTKIEAEFKDGIMRVSIPRVEEENSKEIEVK